MNWFRNLKLAPKLILSFLTVLTLTVGSGVFAIKKLSSVNDQSTIIADSWLPSVEKSGAMNTVTSDLRIAQYRHVVATTDSAMTEAERDIARHAATLAELRGAYVPLITSPEERRLFTQFVVEWGAYMAKWNDVATLSRANRSVEAPRISAPDRKSTRLNSSH